MLNQAKVAFALGGLAGNNAHSAGFLQAALDQDVRPSMISCTSGQIYWTYLYLKALQESHKLLLEEEIKKETATLERIQKSAEFLLGVHEFVRPVYPHEVMQDMAKTMLGTSLKFVAAATAWANLKPFKEYRREMLNVMPGRLLVPQFSEEFLGKIADLFNNKETDIGLAFNTFNPLTGYETVHLNEVARQRLKVEFDRGESAAELDEVDCDQPAETERRYRNRTRYQPITPGSVMDGLWVYQYGFDKSVHPIYDGVPQEACASFDGAFWRQILLSELTWANKIYVVRPLCYRWLGSLPHSYLEIEDLKQEVMFNSAYMGERDKIYLINKLIREKKLEGYHCIDLIEIEMHTQEPYLEYLVENKDLFDRARQRALDAFAQREEMAVPRTVRYGQKSASPAG